MIAPALPSEPPPPSVRRRLAALAYESLLLFGVVFFAGLTFGVALQQRNGLDHRNPPPAWTPPTYAPPFSSSSPPPRPPPPARHLP
ncbi:hypothetical protein DIS09_14190, partial [Burkholderia pseudomallei]